jgi:hypothetical protein
MATATLATTLATAITIVEGTPWDPQRIEALLAEEAGVRAAAVAFVEWKVNLEEMERGFRAYERESGMLVLPLDVKLKKSVRSEGLIQVNTGDKKKRNRRPKPPYDPASPFPQAIDAKQVAAALGCSPQHVYSEVAAGRLPHHRDNGRLYFLVPEIMEYQRNQRIA